MELLHQPQGSFAARTTDPYRQNAACLKVAQLPLLARPKDVTGSYGYLFSSGMDLHAAR